MRFPSVPRLDFGLPWYGLLLLILAAAVAGLVSASGSPLLIAPILGLISLPILLAIPANAVVLGIFALAFVVVGPIGYFGKVSQAYWLPYLLALLLYLHVGAGALLGRSRRRAALPPFYWTIAAFVGVIVLSVAINQTPPLQVVVATKNYLFLWSIFFVFAVGLVDDRVADYFWKGLLVVAAIQLPMSIFQYVRAGAHGWDAVSGTFGGSETGGASGTLGLMMIVSCTLVLGLLRAKHLKPGTAAVLALLSLAPVALAEVKAAVVLFMPVALLLHYSREIGRNPLVLLRLGAIVGALMVGFFAIYQVLHYSQVETGASSRSSLDKITEAIELETDPAHVRVATGEMGRTAIVVFWWREHDMSQIDKMLFGHGPGALRSSSMYIGEIAYKYPYYRMDRHAVAFLLWDLGLVGLGVFVVLLVAGMKHSLALAEHPEIPGQHRVYLKAGAVSLGLLGASLIYMRAAIDSAAGQALMMFCLGQAAYWHARVAAAPASSAKRTGWRPGVRHG